MYEPTRRWESSLTILARLMYNLRIRRTLLGIFTNYPC